MQNITWDEMCEQVKPSLSYYFVTTGLIILLFLMDYFVLRYKQPVPTLSDTDERLQDRIPRDRIPTDRICVWQMPKLDTCGERYD